MNIGDRDNYKPFEGGDGGFRLAGRRRDLKDPPPAGLGKLMGASPYNGTKLSK